MTRRSPRRAASTDAWCPRTCTLLRASGQGWLRCDGLDSPPGSGAPHRRSPQTAETLALASSLGRGGQTPRRATGASCPLSQHRRPRSPPDTRPRPSRTRTPAQRSGRDPRRGPLGHRAAAPHSPAPRPTHPAAGGPCTGPAAGPGAPAPCGHISAARTCGERGRLRQARVACSPPVPAWPVRGWHQLPRRVAPVASVTQHPHRSAWRPV